MISFGPVRVADEVGQGKAKITFSLPDWKEGNVSPARFVVEVGERVVTPKN